MMLLLWLLPNQNSWWVTQNGLTLTTRPNVLKYQLMGVTIQPGVTQGSGDADIMFQSYYGNLSAGNVYWFHV